MSEPLYTESIYDQVTWKRLGSQHLDGYDSPEYGALLIAKDEYPELDIIQCLIQMEVHALEAKRDVPDGADAITTMRALNRYLFVEQGFAGNHDDYYDVRNNYLSDVLERRLGNPLSLAIVQIGLARRLGVPLRGVSFPGHFLLRLDLDDGMLVLDPFNQGRTLDEDELRRRADPDDPGGGPSDRALAGLLRPASVRTMLIRLLRNLTGIHAAHHDWARVARCADRVLLLLPEDVDAMRDRGLAYLSLGHMHGAQTDLQRYLQLQPQAADAGMLRERLIDAGRSSMRLQ